jgi:hypothetical protein
MAMPGRAALLYAIRITLVITIRIVVVVVIVVVRGSCGI